MRATDFCQRHFDDEHPRSFGDPKALPSREDLRMPGAFSRRPKHFGWVGSGFSNAGVFFPRRRPTLHPLTLPSPRSACPPDLRHRIALARVAFACGRRPPFPCEWAEEVSASARPRSSAYDDAREEIAASTDDPERLPSGGRSLAPRGFPRCVSLRRLASVSRCCARPRR